MANPTLTDLLITNRGDKKKGKAFKIGSYTLPKSDPWIVEINGLHYNVPDSVGLLLLHLAKKAKSAGKSAK